MLRKPNHFVLSFVKFTGYLPALLFFKPKIYRQANAPRRLPKPCILVSNHKSLMDFVLYFSAFPFRTLRFQMAEVLFQKNKFFSRFLYDLGGIRVDRNTYDFGFVGETLDVLDHKGIVGIFPESRLPVAGKSFPFKPSVVHIALNTDAPIIPVYTDGNYGLFKRTRMVIGEPVNIKEYLDPTQPLPAERARLTELLQERVYSLKELIS